MQLVQVFKIIDIDGFEFYHNISTKKGSSGSPVILLNNNINIIQVLGIHKLADHRKQLNCGTFIGEILTGNIINNLDNVVVDNNNMVVNNFKNNKGNNTPNNKLKNGKEDNTNILLNNKNLKKNNNYINVEIYIKYDNLFKQIKIINSVGNFDEIKTCKIKINDKLFNLDFFYKFYHKGKHNLKYIFNTNLTGTNNMFSGCEFLTTINL